MKHNAFEKVVLPVLGLFGAITTLLVFIFPNYSGATVNISYLVVVVYFFVIVVAVLGKVIIDLRRSIKDNLYFNNFAIIPKQFVPADDILIIERTIELPLSTSVSVFYKDTLYEKIVAIGYVSHVQERILQIKVIYFEQAERIRALLSEEGKLHKIIVRPSSNISDVMAGLAVGGQK